MRLHSLDVAIDSISCARLVGRITGLQELRLLQIKETANEGKASNQFVVFLNSLEAILLIR